MEKEVLIPLIQFTRILSCLGNRLCLYIERELQVKEFPEQFTAVFEVALGLYSVDDAITDMRIEKMIVTNNYLPRILSEKFYRYYIGSVFNDFMKHMISHHQIAIDISIQHIENTKSDIIMKVLRELIWTQKYEIVMMMEELNSKTENVSEITSNQPFIPTISSSTYPNVFGLTDTYCDPNFFNSTTHKNHNMIVTDKQYINHMIPHHQVAVDMCKILLKDTKSDFLIYLAYRMIRGQESEIMLLNDLLQSPFIRPLDISNRH
jgi:hypothetical protein